MSPPAPVMVDDEAQEPDTNTEAEADCLEEPQEQEEDQQQQHVSNGHQSNNHKHQQFQRQSAGVQKYSGKNNKTKSTFKRIDVDPTRRYHVPEARESWGPNVKGKKFRKEKGKKKRSTGTGARIDGSVRSIRFN